MRFKIQLQYLFYLPSILLLRLLYKKPDAVISFDLGLGDDLLCTVIAQQLKQNGYKRVWMSTCFPEIFLHNPNIDRVIKKNNRGSESLLMRKYLKSIKANIIRPFYTVRDEKTDQDLIPQKHIVKIMCDKAKLNYPKVIKPSFYLSESEKRRGKLYENQICIHSTGKGAKYHMHNKDWYSERFDEVAAVLKKKYTLIQIGSANDYSLKNVVDMRGKTSIRETAALLYNSNFFIGKVGFLMHLARAVECKAIIIYGGRERPDQSGYDFNINLYSTVSCSPCWYWNYCPNDKICMKKIAATDVLQAVEKLTSVSTVQCTV